MAATITVGSGAPASDAYSVGLSAPSEVQAGENVDVSLNITHGTTTTFNAFYTTLTYDASFTYAGDETVSGFTVADDTTNHKLTISKTGANVAISESAAELVLPFTAGSAAATYASAFSLGDAKIDAAANALADAASATVTGSPASVTVNAISYALTDYCTGYKLLKVTGAPDAGKVFAYSGAAMPTNAAGAYCWVVADTVTLDGAKAAVTQINGTATAIAKDGDVNETGVIDINDAQLVYNIYSDFNVPAGITVPMLLEADVNGDGTVTILDCTAAIAKIV